MLDSAGRGWWAGPETATLGLFLAWAWRAAAGELCVGTSWGCLPAIPRHRSSWQTGSPGSCSPMVEESQKTRKTAGAGGGGQRNSWGPEAQGTGPSPARTLSIHYNTLLAEAYCVPNRTRTYHYRVILAGRLSGYKQLCLVLGQTLKWAHLPQQRPLSEVCQMLPLSLKSPSLWWHLGIPDSSGHKDIEQCSEV